MRALNLELYKKLYLVRKAEDVICENYMDDKMKTPMHMSKGGEAISVGVCHALRSEDQVLGTYRSHAMYLAKTEETDRFFGEMYGKVTGTSRGKGGSMHLLAPEKGVISTSAILGTIIPVAVGAAYANKLKNNRKVVAAFFGDGAIDEGVFWESINMAALKKLPVLFVCEDNDIAVHSPAGERHGYRDIAEIARQFYCDVYVEDTTDVEIIYELTKEALQKMKETSRPAFMHLKYYRYLEHVGVFEDFKAGYRPKEEYEKWLKVDPVVMQRKKLQQWFAEDEVKAIEKELDGKIRLSAEAAEEAPFPEPNEIYENLFA